MATATTEAAGKTTAAAGNECQCVPCRERAKKGKAWRWVTRHSDLTKAPLPTVRWALLLILGLCCLAVGIPLDVGDWLAPIIIAGVLILPDVAGFGIAGVRLDLKQAQDDIATLRTEANAQARSSSIAILAVGADVDKLVAATKDVAQEAAKVSRDQASGPATPWPAPSGVDRPPAQEVP